MAKILLSVLFVIAILVTFVLAANAGKYNTKLSKTVQVLLFISSFATLSQLLVLVSPTENIAIMATSLYYISVTAAVVAQVEFAALYTKQFEFKGAFKKLVYGLAAIDIVSMAVNMFTRHSFDVKLITDQEMRLWVIDNITPWFRGHLFFASIVCGITVGMYIFKVVTAPKYLKRKYLYIIIVQLIILLCDLVYFVTGFSLNVMSLFFVALAALIYYYGIKNQSKDIVDNMFQTLSEENDDAVLCYNIENDCVYQNEQAKLLFSDEAASKEFVESFRNNVDIDDPDTRRKIWEISRFIGTDEFVYKMEFHRIWLEHGTFIGYFIRISDITYELKEMKEKFRMLTLDRLTNVYSRNYFFERIQQLIIGDPTKTYYMICTNIRNFKIYNDIFGAENGDKLLVDQAKLLRDVASPGTIYGRISGDQFAVLIREDKFNEKEFLNHIDVFRRKYATDTYELQISAGVYRIADNTEPPMTSSDKAMLACREASINSQSIVYYRDDMLDGIRIENQMLIDFDKALENRQFLMYLQPQFSIKDGVLGGEALVRWRHPEKGVIFPGAFIDVIEKAGLVYKLDKYIWEEAAKTLADWKSRGSDFYISVNVSVRDFYYINVYEEFTSLVKRYEIDPKKLRIEITESAFMERQNEVIDIIARLRKFGFILEMDDFGSGYSSLNMLKNINVDVVKIDRAFVVESETSERSKKILRAIIGLIKMLDMGIVTEGVETREQVDAIYDMGGEVFQGYYFDRPISLQDFEEKYMK